MDEGMTDSILADIPPITVTIALLGGPFKRVATKREYVTELARRTCPSLSRIRESVECEVWDFLLYSLRQQVPNGRVATQADSVTGAKQIVIDDGIVKCIYEMSEQAQRQAGIGVYPYTFSWSEPSFVDIAAYHRGLFTVDRESRWTGQESESLAYLRVASGISRRFDSLQVRDVWVPSACHEVPTTYCFDCGQMVPITETWTKKHDPNYALCEACFRAAEGAGRAKEGMIL